ncbi:MAG: AraC family transcriptional regulator [Burkholderiaceae bacterium]|jgi:AraC-like DNA-binding protein|nr:MAG: AraC family transcriptional regulator [Burkholderiaceae bacterium]
MRLAFHAKIVQRIPVASNQVAEKFVRAAALKNFREVTAAFGYDVDAAMRRAGLSQKALKNPDLRLPANKVAWLLEDAARATGCDSIGLRMVQSRKLSNLGSTSLLLTYQATLRDVLTTIIDRLHLLNDALVLHIENAGSLVIIREEVMARSSGRQDIEMAVGVLYRICEGLLGSRWRPKSVHFSHDSPSDPTVHRAMFSCTVVFNADFNGIVCLASDLDASNPSADPLLVHYAEEMLEPAAEPNDAQVSDEVRRMIYVMLPSGRVTCELVARNLGRSLRTLQRELDETGTSFTVLLAEAKRNLVRRYIVNPHYSLEHIADLLGYSTHSAFARWFKTEFGQSPISLRRQSAKRHKDA